MIYYLTINKKYLNQFKNKKTMISMLSKISKIRVIISNIPLSIIISLFYLILTGVLTINGFNNSIIFFFLSLISLLLSMSFWFRDITGEGSYLGDHLLIVQKGLSVAIAVILGILLFGGGKYIISLITNNNFYELSLLYGGLFIVLMTLIHKYTLTIV